METCVHGGLKHQVKWWSPLFFFFFFFKTKPERVWVRLTWPECRSPAAGAEMTSAVTSAEVNCQFDQIQPSEFMLWYRSHPESDFKSDWTYGLVVSWSTLLSKKIGCSTINKKVWLFEVQKLVFVISEPSKIRFQIHFFRRACGDEVYASEAWNWIIQRKILTYSSAENYFYDIGVVQSWITDQLIPMNS